MLRTGTSCAVLLALAAGVAAAGEPGKAALDEVVVTATRTERKAEEVPAAVTAVTKEDIKETRMFSVKEALTGISGVQAESKNGGYDARLIIRGAGLKARYGVREIMVLVDGVPVTDPDGMTRLDMVDPQLIERIDVVKGPNSTLYGANAAGGVINIITKEPYEAGRSAKAGIGSYDTQLYNLTVSETFGNLSLLATGSRRSTESWREWNRFATNQGSFKASYTTVGGTLIESAFSYTKADLRLPGTLTKEQFATNIRQLTSEVWRHSGRYSEVYNASLKAEREFGEFKVKPLVFYQRWHHIHPVTGLINVGGADVFGIDLQTDWKHSLFARDALLTCGFSGQTDSTGSRAYEYGDIFQPGGAETRIIKTLSDRLGGLAERNEETVSKGGVFVQESFRPGEEWLVDAGVRFDAVNFDIDDRYFSEYVYAKGYYDEPASPRTRNNRTFTAVSPRLGAVWTPAEGVHFYGNLSTGFQTPQTSELGTNPDLEPSTTYNVETGMKLRSDRGNSLDLALFYMLVEDDIVQTLEEDGTTSFSNAGKSRKRGIETSARIKVVDSVFVGGTYTFSDFVYLDFAEIVNGTSRDRSGNRFPYVPMHQYSAFLELRPPSGFRGKIETVTWGTYWTSNANTGRYHGYENITNLFLGYETKNLEVAFDISNLFDQRYAMEVTNDGRADRYRPGAPISAMGRLTVKF